MYKEDIEKVAIILGAYNLPREPDSCSSGVLLKMERWNCARHILAELGYHKPPKEKPPLLSDKEQALISQEYPGYWVIEYPRAIAQAQLDICIKYYEG